MPGTGKRRSGADDRLIEAEVTALISGARWARLNGMDLGSIFLLSAGIITWTRGVLYLTSAAPTASAFTYFGEPFVLTWSLVWILVGFTVCGVALTGYRWPLADRAAAFALLSLWWMWALLYYVSAIFDTGRVGPDLLTAVILSVTGVALTSGVLLGLRQAQDRRLRKVAVKRIAYLDKCIEQLVKEKDELEAEVERLTGGEGG